MKTIVFLVIAALLVGGVWWYGRLQNTTQSDANGGLGRLLAPLNGSSEDSTSEKDRVVVVAEGLDTPWAVAFLPEGEMLVTERKGTVRKVSAQGLEQEPVATIANAREIGEGGLLGLTLHQNFEENHFVYLYYTYSGSVNDTMNRVVRMRYENGTLTNEEVMVDGIPGASNHNGGRIHFGPDGFLYITTGDAQEPSLAQDTNSLAGKILRVRDDGSPAPGNPFGNRVYAYGHRNPQGIDWDEAGQLWETEHGPSGVWPNCCQDEFNRIEVGKNYGWPESVGDVVREGTIEPVVHSGRDIWAPGGLAYIDGAFYFTGLRGQALYRVTPTGELETFFNGEYGRLREVITGADGMLYLSTSNRDGRGNPKSSDDKILRINPANL